jgi:hypothetical protein
MPNGRRVSQLPLEGQPVAASQTETVQLRCRLDTNRHRHVPRSQDRPVEGPSWRLSRRRGTTLLSSRSLLRAPLRAFPQVSQQRNGDTRSSVYLRRQWNHLHEDWPKSRCPGLSRCARGLRRLLEGLATWRCGHEDGGDERGRHESRSGTMAVPHCRLGDRAGARHPRWRHDRCSVRARSRARDRSGRRVALAS